MIAVAKTIGPCGWAVVGGGRWGRVLVESALRVLPQEKCVRLVTRHTMAAVTEWLSSQTEEVRRRVRLTADLDGVLADSDIDAVIVANRALDHAGMAERVLLAGKHAFVEKPFTLDVSAAEALVTIAAQGDRVLVVGLEYLFASYLHHLRGVVGASAIADMAIIWCDPGEVRYGEVKRFDPAISVFQDVFPHIWSILKVLLPERVWRVRSAQIGQSAAEIVLADGSADVAVTMRRDAEHRIRSVRVTLVDRTVVSLDFSSEPGRLLVNGLEVEGCRQWHLLKRRPVHSELSAFLQAIEGRTMPPHAASVCLGSVRLAAEAEQCALTS
jgi:predicted dehydrogenase